MTARVAPPTHPADFAGCAESRTRLQAAIDAGRASGVSVRSLHEIIEGAIQNARG